MSRKRALERGERRAPVAHMRAETPARVMDDERCNIFKLLRLVQEFVCVVNIALVAAHEREQQARASILRGGGQSAFEIAARNRQLARPVELPAEQRIQRRVRRRERGGALKDWPSVVKIL